MALNILGAWENLKGNISHGARAAAARAPNLVDVFSVIGINEVYQKVLTGTTWTPDALHWDAFGETF